MSYIAGHANAIGYVSGSTALAPGVKVVTIKD
jgi:hypothetical protein